MGDLKGKESFVKPVLTLAVVAGLTGVGISALRDDNEEEQQRTDAANVTSHLGRSFSAGRPDPGDLTAKLRAEFAKLGGDPKQADAPAKGMAAAAKTSGADFAALGELSIDPKSVTIYHRSGGESAAVPLPKPGIPLPNGKTIKLATCVEVPVGNSNSADNNKINGPSDKCTTDAAALAELANAASLVSQTTYQTPLAEHPAFANRRELTAAPRTGPAAVAAGGPPPKSLAMK